MNVFASVVVAISIISFISLSSGFISNTAYAQPAPDVGVENDSANTNEATDDNKDELSCAIAKMGWILCPLIETSGEIGDRAFQLLAKTFLETEPELVAVNGAGNSYSGTYQSWELARNIANVMFIIAFLIIILSQVTGRGLDNYGIKKTLPRLIIAAIAVNVSFFICQVMVDLSNILGYEIQNFLVDMARTVSDRTAMPIASDIDLHTGGEGLGSGTLAVIAAAVLATVAIVWLILPLLIAGIGTIVITAIIVVIILLLRKAFIVLLVVVSPVAFVLYLLPNTEQYFRKWLSMFWKLLMVFPVIGLLFGAGQLASAVVLVAGTNTGASESASDNTYYDGSDKCITLPSSAKNATNNEAKVGSCGTSSTPLMLGLIAAGIAVAPLLAVWSVLRGALAGAGAIGGKISGAVETYTGKGVGKASERLKKTSLGRGMEARKGIKQNYKDQKFAEKMGGIKRSGRFTRIAARGVQGNIGRVVGGSMGAQDKKLSANFAGSGEKLEDQEKGEKKALLRQEAKSAPAGGEYKVFGKSLRESLVAGDTANAKAAEEMTVEFGKEGVNELRDIFGEIDRGELKVNPESLNQLLKHIAVTQSSLKGSDADVFKYATSSRSDRGYETMQTISNNPDTFSSVTNEQMASQSDYVYARGSGAQAALGKEQTIVDQNGATHVVTRAAAILSSDAAKSIKQANMKYYNAAAGRKPESEQ